MEIRQLRYFVAVAEARHFGRAAEGLKMSQSPLSHAIRRLESDLDVELFTRTTRQVSLTPAGESLLLDARRVLDGADLAADNVQRVARGQVGSIRIGTTGLAALRHLPALARTAARALPDVELIVQSDALAADLARDVADGQLDLALLRPTDAVQRVSTALVAVERMVVAVSTGSPFARLDRIRLDQLAETPFAAYRSPESAINTVVRAACSRAGFTPTSAGRADEVAVLLALVAGGLGISVLPEAVRSTAVDGVAYVDLDDDLSTELRLAWSPHHLTPPASRLLHALDRNGFTLTDSTASPSPHIETEA